MAQKPDTAKGKPATPTDSLFNSLSGNDKNGPVVVFESSRLILSQTTETVKKNNLNFMVFHRFGDLAGSQGGGETFFGLDAIADVYVGFEYGLTNNLNIDIGRATIPVGGGMVDLELKYAVLHQLSDGSSPIAISVIAQTGVRPYGAYTSFGDRVSYFAQAIFARKFSHRFSFQIAPSIMQNNLPVQSTPGSGQQIFSISSAATLKVTKLMSLVVDYGHSFYSAGNLAYSFSDPLGAGIQVVTGGHVFTLNVTNAKAVSEISSLSRTTSDYARGQFRLGFTISRTFDFNHKEQYTPKK
jgi:hypothetical protein